MHVVRSIGLVLCLSACVCPQKAAPEQASAAAPRVPVATPPEQPALPPGVLARAQGSQGVIEVVERDGMRLLTIDGAVQAAVPQGRDVGRDPLVPLLRGVRPAARTALVIGLGSGKTAGDLAASGFEVEAVELEAAVVDMARAHFGYAGKAVVADGLAHVKASTARWDVILVDALVVDLPPAHLIGGDGMTVLAEHLTDGGVIAVRMLGEPGIAMDARRTLQAALESHHTDLYGSGVGVERQNLALLGSRKPMNAVNLSGAALWPIPHDMAAWAMPQSSGDRERRVELIGYLVRLPDGALAIDLPHWEMGAVRYLLRGNAVADLDAALGKGAAFPTTGDIGSDGDTSKTLLPLLGGGGVKRSDVRFSHVVVAVDGVARLISVVDPDAASRVPADLRGDAPTDERLPYGGALYELEVTGVGKVFSGKDWAASTDLIRRASAQAARGTLDKAAPPLNELADKLEGILGPFAERTLAWRRARALAVGLTAEAAALLSAGRASDFMRGRACDRAGQVEIAADDEPAGAFTPVMRALRRCAERHYQAALKTGAPDQRTTAAARLLHLYETDWEDRGAQKKAKALRGRFPELEPADSPPM